MDALRIKSVTQIAHFIQDTPKSPYIRFVGVRLILEKLRGHVVGRTDTCVREISRTIQHLGNTEIAQTDLAIFQENVLGFHVSM